jgi:DNA repair exonuclease SbcCD ATPase subunit
MRILRIKIRNFRGVGECEVKFATEGVTIIEGPNEVGKTSLSEAIDLLLTERDDSSKRTVKAVKPVGKDVGAEAEIEMASGVYRFVYRKCWHRQKSTELDILEPERSQLTGREAHDKVRAILDETLDSALWEALRIRQGTQLDQAVLAGGSLGRALDLAAGGNAAGEREDDLWLRITAERDQYWTSTGQEKSDRTALKARVAESAAQVAQIEQSLRDLEGDADEVDRLLKAAIVLVERQEEQADLEQTLGAQFASIEHLRNEIDRLKGSCDTAQADRDRVHEISKSRTDLVERVATATETVLDHESKVEGAVPALASAVTRLKEAEDGTRDGRAQVSAADAAHRRAVGDETYRRQEIELSQLSERLERVQEAIRRRSEAEEVLETNEVDDEVIRRIQEAYVDVARADAAASAGASAIHTRALVDLTVTANGETVSLVAGEEHDLVVTDSAEIEVPNVMSVSVTAGTEAKSAAERVSIAEAAFKATCDEVKVEDVAGAQVAAESRKEALRVVVSADKTIKDDLRDLTTEALDQKIKTLKTRITTYESERAPEPVLPADLDEAHRIASKCDGELQVLRDELARFEADESTASGALQSLRLDDAGTKANLEQARALEKRETTSLATARREASDEEISGQLAKAEAALAECTEKLQQAKEGLKAENPESVETLLNNARDVLKRLAADLHENDTRVRELRTKLGVKGDEGLAQQLDVAKSEFAQISVRQDRLETRAMAAKVLYDAFAARRAEAHRRYVAPFREQIEGLARIVFGPSIEVELDDELRISRRTLDGITLNFADLSTGAKEQLGMISRLACASIVSTDGGAPVIFDDALGWSDPGKLDSMGAVIRTAGQSCQIIILTCTPGRYAGVGKAEVVKLPA